MSDLYFWVNGEVKQKSWGDGSPVIYGVPCVDSEDRPDQLYRIFQKGGRCLVLDELPPEFRLALLLMGVYL